LAIGLINGAQLTQTVGVGGAILFPQQLQRYARALEFAMDHRPVWLRPTLLDRCRRPIKEALKCRVG
jgi:predicted ATPase